MSSVIHLSHRSHQLILFMYRASAALPYLSLSNEKHYNLYRIFCKLFFKQIKEVPCFYCEYLLPQISSLAAVEKNSRVLYLTIYPGGVYNAYIPRGLVGK